MNPLILLDVDGVLNALSDRPPNTSVRLRWQRGLAHADGTSWPLVRAGRRRTADVLARAGRGSEVQWLTTWGHDANGEPRVLLGLPHLDVAGTYDEGDSGGACTTGGASHAAAAPSPRNRCPAGGGSKTWCAGCSISSRATGRLGRRRAARRRRQLPPLGRAGGARRADRTRTYNGLTSSVLDRIKQSLTENPAAPRQGTV